MKRVISIILAFIFLIQIIVFIPSCYINNMKLNSTGYLLRNLLYKSETIERLYGEKQEEINGKTLLTEYDLIELFDMDRYVIIHHDMNGNIGETETVDLKDNVNIDDPTTTVCAILSYDNSDYGIVLYKHHYFYIYGSIEDAHTAYCSIIANDIDSRDSFTPFVYRINNIVIYHREHNEMPVANIEYIDEICGLFNIDFENERICIKTNEYFKKMKTDVIKMISYFENDDNYGITKIEYGDISTGFPPYNIVDNYLYAYIITNQNIDSYLVIKEFADDISDDDERFLCTLNQWVTYWRSDKCNGMIVYDNHLISSDNTKWLYQIIKLHDEGCF